MQKNQKIPLFLVSSIFLLTILSLSTASAQESPQSPEFLGGLSLLSTISIFISIISIMGLLILFFTASRKQRRKRIPIFLILGVIFIGSLAIFSFGIQQAFIIDFQGTKEGGGTADPIDKELISNGKILNLRTFIDAGGPGSTTQEVIVSGNIASFGVRREQNIQDVAYIFSPNPLNISLSETLIQGNFDATSGGIDNLNQEAYIGVGILCNDDFQVISQKSASGDGGNPPRGLDFRAENFNYLFDGEKVFVEYTYNGNLIEADAFPSCNPIVNEIQPGVVIRTFAGATGRFTFEDLIFEIQNGGTGEGNQSQGGENNQSQGGGEGNQSQGGENNQSQGGGGGNQPDSKTGEIPETDLTAIIGFAMLIIIILALGVLGFVWYRRRKKRK